MKIKIFINLVLLLLMNSSEATQKSSIKVEDNKNLVFPIFKVRPVYPKQELLLGVEGYVKLKFIIQTDGSVRDVSVVEAKPIGKFEDAAIDAVLKWKFKPHLKNGEPSEISVLQELKFKSNKKKGLAGWEKIQNCKAKEATHERVIIDLSKITTKKNPKSKGKQPFFPSQLYCDHPKLSKKKCTDKSIWLSYNQLIKRRVGKNKILCLFRNASYENGSKDDKIIVYLHKKKAI